METVVHRLNGPLCLLEKTIIICSLPIWPKWQLFRKIHICHFFLFKTSHHRRKFQNNCMNRFRENLKNVKNGQEVFQFKKKRH